MYIDKNKNQLTTKLLLLLNVKKVICLDLNNLPFEAFAH